MKECYMRWFSLHKCSISSLFHSSIFEIILYFWLNELFNWIFFFIPIFWDLVFSFHLRWSRVNIETLQLAIQIAKKARSKKCSNNNKKSTQTISFCFISLKRVILSSGCDFLVFIFPFFNALHLFHSAH